MNKAELVAKIAEKSKLTKKDAEAALNAVTSTIVEVLSEGEKISLVGFGSFETRDRAARTARNPRNPEEVIQVEATTVPVFRPGKQFKQSILDAKQK